MLLFFGGMNLIECCLKIGCKREGDGFEEGKEEKEERMNLLIEDYRFVYSFGSKVWK